MHFKGILLSAFLIAGSVNAATKRSIIPAIAAIGGYVAENGKDWPLYEGLVLGLQQNSENEAHQCYQSFETLKADVEKMDDYIAEISSTSAGGNTVVDALTDYPWF